MGLKMKNVNIMGIHQFLRQGGVTRKQYIYMENCLKRDLEQFARRFKKNRKEGVFEGG